MSKRIILADDHPVVLTGIRMTLRNTPYTSDIVCEAGSTDELIQKLKTHPCDILITDFSMPNGIFPDGIMLISHIRRQFPQIKIIIMTMLNNAVILRELLTLGVSGLFDKNQPIKKLVHAVSRTPLGLTYISQTFSTACAPSQHGENALQALSKRETEILRLLGHNYSGRDIAKLLNRSEKTISRHKRMAMQKLGIQFNGELIEYAKKL